MAVYCRPQESGNHFECRWMALSDAAGGRGTLLTADSGPLSMGCGHFDPARDLDTVPGTATPRVRHGAGLVERDLTCLTVDGAQAGVGGIDSWGQRPLEAHRIDGARPCAWACTLRPFGAADGAPAELAARLREALAGQMELAEAAQAWPRVVRPVWTVRGSLR